MVPGWIAAPVGFRVIILHSEWVVNESVRLLCKSFPLLDLNDESASYGFFFN